MAPLKSAKRQRITTKMRRKRASARNATKRPKRGASSTGDEPLPSLPEELIFEILFRVPVKSLIRFKCVSKSWEALISDPKFAKNHLRISSADPSAEKLLSSVIGDQAVLSFSAHALCRDPVFCSGEALSINTSDKHQVLGSCNGLVCVCDIDRRYVMLWNPATKLTSRRFPLSLNPGMKVIFYGFGYDDLNDKYKLLVVEKGVNLTVTKVFTFGEDSWKVITNHPFHVPAKREGMFVSGTLNWLTNNWRLARGQNRREILSFDMRTETYSRMLLKFGDSKFHDIDRISDVGLNVLRNCLSLYFFDLKKRCWNGYLMKEYGVEDSWTKFMTIPNNMIQDPYPKRVLPPRLGNKLGLISPKLRYSLDLVYLSDNGVVIFKTDFCHVQLYNPENGCCHLHMRNSNRRLHFLHMYHESLVSPMW